MRSLMTLIVVAFSLGFAFALCASAGQARTVAAQQHPATVLSASVGHVRPPAHPSLPSWVHWAPASSRAARQVCGRGVQAITVWGGSGDTSAVVCGDGKADVS